jgi:uncharacterized protein (TIGR02270 family)
MTPGIPLVIEQHREEAGFLWVLRSKATGAPDITLDDLIELDQRLDAHMDGLRIAGESGWELCQEALAWPDPGDVFAAAVLAFGKANPEQVETVLSAAAAAPELSRAVVSALAWLSWPQSEPGVRRLLASDVADRRRIGLAASALHRLYLRETLIEALQAEDAALRARAIKAAGELGCRELLPLIVRQRQGAEGDCRFYAAWSAALLGDPHALPLLLELTSEGGPRAVEALALIAGLMPPGDVGPWLRGLEKRTGGQRLAVIAAGKLGDPAFVPWLIDCMTLPELARPAGEALRAITGADIAALDLAGEPPDGFEAGPTEDAEDENVELDPDENLAWPAPARVQAWWQSHKKDYPSGVRHMAGVPISLEQCAQALRFGRQRQRADAALQSALLQPGRPLFEVRARGSRQRQALGAQP